MSTQSGSSTAERGPSDAEPQRPAFDAAPAPGATPASRRRLALVGNPNVGKSVIFGALTGTYATVSNYPGTTVEVARAAARTDPALEIVDTPGVNSLTPNSEDERVTRDILLAGVDCAVQVADAKNLSRALVVSLQLAEAEVPFVLVLNMMDEVAERGMRIDTAALSAALGVPVVETIAVTGRGLRGLADAVPHAAVSPVRIRYPAAIERALPGLEAALSTLHAGRRWVALLCLSGDTTLRPWLTQHVSDTTLAAIEDTYRTVQGQLHAQAAYQVSRARLQAAEHVARSVTQRTDTTLPVVPALSGRETAIGATTLLACAALIAGDWGVVPETVADWVRLLAWAGIAFTGVTLYRSPALRVAFGRWAAQPRTGIAVLGVVLYLVYRFVGVFAAGTAVDFLEDSVFGTYLNPAVTGLVDRSLAATGLLSSPIIAAVAQFLRDLLVGPYGVVTVALTYAIAIILPIVTAFFFAFSLLEDSGYLPRLAVVVNRAFRAMGLNGKAVLPMVLGLGCDTMATLTARILETRKERVVVTLLLALGVPCSAQLGVILGLFGALPAWAPLVWGGVVLGVLFAVGFLAARLLPGERSDLILEMPPIRRPQIGNVLVKTLGRLEWYLKEAVPIFILGTLVLFLLDAAGLLARLVAASEPVVAGILQLPPRAAEAFLIGFFRRDYGSAGIYALFQQGALSPVQAVVALVTITLFVPCVANFFIIVKEHGWRTALAMSAFIFPFAFAVGGMVNLALRAIGVS